MENLDKSGLKYFWSKVKNYISSRDARTVQPVGSSIMWYGPEDTIPSDYMREDGRALKVADYPELFAVIGYTYGGEGDTFNLPDSRGRTAVHLEDSDEFGTLGAKVGWKIHTLTLAQIPSHNHSVAAHSHTIPSHTHTGPSHTHSVGAHNHSIPSHTHTGPSHTHAVGQHTHSIPSHTHTGPSHSHSTPNHQHTFTTSSNGGHAHIIYLNGDTTFPLVGNPGWSGANYSNAAKLSCGSGSYSGYNFYAGNSNNTDGAHQHTGTTTSNNGGNTGASGTGATGAWSGTSGKNTDYKTGASGTGATGAWSGTSGNSTAFNSGASGTGATGAWSGNTGEKAAFNTGSNGSGESFNIIQPSIVAIRIIKVKSDAYTKDIRNLDTAIDEAQTKIATLESSLATLQDTITALQASTKRKVANAYLEQVDMSGTAWSRPKIPVGSGNFKTTDDTVFSCSANMINVKADGWYRIDVAYHTNIGTGEADTYIEYGGGYEVVPGYSPVNTTSIVRYLYAGGVSFDINTASTSWRLYHASITIEKLS